MNNLESLMQEYCLSVTYEGDVPNCRWGAYIRDNLFNEDGSECCATGNTPLEAVQNSIKLIEERVKNIDVIF